MKKLLTWLVAILTIVSLLAWFGGRWLLSDSVADYQGTRQLQGLKHPVEVSFDSLGIPQVWAKGDDDLYLTLGWLHAAERLFQMELIRRVSYGELSELFGESLLSVDIRQRRIGFARRVAAQMERLDRRSLNALQKYCDGINAWIAQKSVLPPEFIVLSLTPRKWTPQDCMTIAYYQTWYSHALMDHDRSFSELIETLGRDINTILKAYKSWSPSTIQDNYIESIFSGASFPMRMSQASNSWVAAPHKSTSGTALHASDPHLTCDQIPGFWYLAGLHSDSLNVLGVTSPGVPFVMMGHNGKIAFSFTVASIDIVDYFRFQRHPQDSLKILTSEGFQPLEETVEQIRVNGESTPREVIVYNTPRGPVVQKDSAHVIALKWAGFDTDLGKLAASAFRFSGTDNFEDFRKAVTSFGALDVNWVYSDIKGNIGYQLGAPIPIRTFENSFLELPGEDTLNRWIGYEPLAHTPHALNPVEGWLASCNNQIVSENWPQYLPGFYDPYRIIMASELLASRDLHSPQDFMDMQLDRRSAIVRQWKPLLIAGAKKAGQSELAEQLQAWDNRMLHDQRLPAVFALWWQFLTKGLFEDDLGENWPTAYHLREEVLDAGLRDLIDDRRTEEKIETRVDISAAVLEEVLEEFGMPLFGDISKLYMKHPLGRVAILDSWLNLNRGPLPMSGDKGTLNMNFMRWLPDSREFVNISAPSMRFVLDWSDVNSFTINTNLGQSGNPFSRHYDDQLPYFYEGKRWVVPFEKSAVMAKKASLLVLNP